MFADLNIVLSVSGTCWKNVCEKIVQPFIQETNYRIKLSDLMT